MKHPETAPLHIRQKINEALKNTPTTKGNAKLESTRLVLIVVRPPINWRTAGRHLLSYVLQGITPLGINQDTEVVGDDWKRSVRLNTQGCG